VASGSELLASYGANLANLTSLLKKLPAPLQSYLDSALVHASGVTEYLESTTGCSPTTLYSTAAAILLLATVPAVAARSKKMSSRYGFSVRGGLSPFTSSLGQGIPAVTDDDYSYITSEDLETIDAPRGHHHHHDEDHYSHSAPGPALSFGHRKPAYDVMLIKYKDVTYPEHFPAYSIGDGKLEVNDVIERVKMIMNLSPREARGIRLFYKGRRLREPKAPIREYGVKNNSEVMVVFGEPVGESSGDSSEEIVVVGRDDYDAPKKPKKKSRGRRRPDDRSPRESGSSFSLEVPVDSSRRGISRVRTQSPSSLSAISGASAAAAVPGGPIEKLNSIAAHFEAKLRPPCYNFIDSPPSDPKKLKDDHRRISETVMQQVLLKLDEVDVAAEEGARALRKQIISGVQGILKRMDDIEAGK